MKIRSRRNAADTGLARYFTGKKCKRGHTAERYVCNGKCVTCASEDYARWNAANPGLHARLQRARNAADPDKAKEIARRSAERRAKGLPKATRPRDTEVVAALPAKVRATAAAIHQWAKANPGRIKASAKRWRDAHPETIRQMNQRQYDRVSPEERRAKARRRYKPDLQREAMKRWQEKDPKRARDVKQRGLAARQARERAAGYVSATDIKRLRERQHGRCAGCGKASKQLELDHIVPVARGGTSDPSNLQLLCRPCNRSKSATDPIEWAQRNGRLL